MQEVICGDSLEIMKGFADKSFDLVLTDPPWGIYWQLEESLEGGGQDGQMICRASESSLPITHQRSTDKSHKHVLPLSQLFSKT
jgi:hypothetical protein